MILLLIIISTIPIIDISFNNYIQSFKIQKYTQYFSDKIVYFNIIINLLYLYYYLDYWNSFVRYFIELFIVNFCFKCLLDRPRPKETEISKYYSVFDIKISKNWLKNQSFPSGHVTTVYLTYNLINNLFFKNFYLFLVLLTAISRINLGDHHLSDCCWSILICNCSLFLFKYVKTFINI
jgi:membrane-associated phospholipid phosphatase